MKIVRVRNYYMITETTIEKEKIHVSVRSLNMIYNNKPRLLNLHHPCNLSFPKSRE